jgi:sporulation protein YlmC with PRC-barrel domain
MRIPPSADELKFLRSLVEHRQGNPVAAARKLDCQLPVSFRETFLMTKKPLGYGVAFVTAAVLASGSWAQQSKPQTPKGQETQQNKPLDQKQQQGQQQGQGEQSQMAQKCVQDLRALSERMNKDGYWLTGWGTRWGSEAATRTTPPPGTGQPPPAGTGQKPPAGTAAPSGQTAPRAGTMGPDPWRDARWGVESPRYQISTLYRAANVLAYRGEQQACDGVMAELRDVYDDHVADLKQAGVKPGQITTWRQGQIAAAKPVAQLKAGGVNMADVIGMEIRNAKDESLGTVDDIIFDPKSNNISYIVVSRGGFLGMGEDHVAVPWKSLRATPGMNMLVLPVSEEVMEQAPKVDPDRFGTTDPQEAKPVDDYWSKHIQG